MKRVIAVLLCLLFPVAAFASDGNSYKINYDGGSLPGIKAGTDAKLFIDPNQIRIVHGEDHVAASDVNTQALLAA